MDVDRDRSEDRWTSIETYQYRFGRRCVAAVWLDGVRLEGVEGIDLRALERLKTEDIEAVEVSSTTEVPARFAPRNFRSSGTASCGAVVIWTRQNKR